MKLPVQGKIHFHEKLESSLLGKFLQASGTISLLILGTPNQVVFLAGDRLDPVLIVDVGGLALIPAQLLANRSGWWVPAHSRRRPQYGLDCAQVLA